uniref:RNA-binding protein 41 n=1 Tax=Gouania willdenowi TaxID=441366 RepID=A0A8C5HQ28_GOUWI
QLDWQCFAPASLYRPFGDQAAGVRSLSQFQALQDGEKELVNLRELGLTDAEIQLWQSRDAPDAVGKSHGVCAAPGAKEQRLQVIRDKMEARVELMSRPQRFASSRSLSRREMEIERSLFQGSDRLGFLSALYHRVRRDRHVENSQQGASSSDPMDCLYKDILSEETQVSQHDPDTKSTTESDQRDHNQAHADLSDPEPASQTQPSCSSVQSQPRIDISQPIGSLCAASGTDGPLTVRGEIQTLTDEEILKNRECEEVIRSIPRFKNYQQGNPSKVLCVKNLSAQATVAQLVALFSRFEQKSGTPVLYRLLTGRLKGQAFITLPDVETAHNALQLVHGYRLLGKPLVVEFSRERHRAETKENH